MMSKLGIMFYDNVTRSNDEQPRNNVLLQCYKILMMSKQGKLFYDNVTRYK